MKRNILLYLATVLIFAGCNSNTSGPTNVKELSFLKIGNKWVYSVTDFNSDGSIQRTRLDSMEIIGTKILNGEEYFAYLPHGYHRIDEEGLWWWVIGLSEKRHLVKYPAVEGEIWGHDTEVIDYGSMHEDKGYQNIGMYNSDTTISTEAGKFSCLVTVQHGTLASDGNPYFDDSLFVDPQYGIIKTIYNKRDSATKKLYKTSEVRLIKHNLP